ncbi:MAG: hypothetical protein EHM23_03865 [Acidobacteria bacterium]|nr:MAG: hypothetical protein EHM23_03865 [Acidobacteriota bacterium]
MTVRILGVVSCLLGLAALSFYSARTGSAEVDTIPEIIAKGGLPNGQEVALTSDVKITDIGADRFVAQQGRARIGVLIPAQLKPTWEETKPGIQNGDYVSLRAIYRAPGYLEAREFHVHKGRRLKIWVSLVALLVVGLLIVKQVREGSNA